MNKKIYFFQVITLFFFAFFSVAHAETILQPVQIQPPTPAVAQPVTVTTPASLTEVAGLFIGKTDPNSMLGKDPYLSFTKSGTNVILLIHTNSKILSLDPLGTQLQSFTDNLGTDLIAAGRLQKVEWQAAHSTVAPASNVTDNGIQFENTKITKDGNGVLLTINSTALPKPGATILTIKGQISLNPSDSSQPPAVATQPNVDMSDEGTTFTVNNQPVTLKLYYSQSGNLAAYKVDSSLAITKLEAYGLDGTTLLGSVIMVPGQDNVLTIPTTSKKISLKIYYNAQNKKLIIPINVSTGVGI